MGGYGRKAAMGKTLSGSSFRPCRASCVHNDIEDFIFSESKDTEDGITIVSDILIFTLTFISSAICRSFQPFKVKIVLTFTIITILSKMHYFSHYTLNIYHIPLLCLEM